MRKRFLGKKVEVDDCEFDSDYIIVSIVYTHKLCPGIWEWIKGIRSKLKEVKKEYRGLRRRPSRWYLIPDYQKVDIMLQIELDDIRDQQVEFDKYIGAIEKYRSTTHKKQ